MTVKRKTAEYECNLCIWNMLFFKTCGTCGTYSAHTEPHLYLKINHVVSQNKYNKI